MTEDTFAWQVVLYYDHSMLNALSVSKTAASTSEFFAGHATTWAQAINPRAYPPIGNLQAVLVYETLSSPDSQPGPHWGTLFKISFQVVNLPPENESFTSKFDISTEYPSPRQNTFVEAPNGDYLSFTTYDGTYSCINPKGFATTRYSWPMFHHDLKHTGYTESPAPNTNQTIWNYTTGGYVYSPVVVDDKVYVGSGDKNVYCLDALTGALVWNYTTGDLVLSSPAVVGGKVYVGSYDKNVYCLDASTGALTWNYTTGSWVFSSPAVADGRVYVGSYDNRVYCLNALTGAHIWNYTTGYYVTSSPAIVDDKVYVGSCDNKTYCLDALTGAQIWSYTTGNFVGSSPAVVDGKVYVGSDDNNVYCLMGSTGALVWNYTTGYSVTSSPAVVDGKVYVGSADNRVYCLNALTGAHIWNYTTGYYVTSSPAIVDDKVYVGSCDNKTYCLDALTGAQIWSYTTGNFVGSSPAVADGVVFTGSDDGIVYAFGSVVRVPEDYKTVQEAIDAADPGTTIWVAPGIYNESLVINETITIIGKLGSEPVFNGGGSGIAITLLPGASGSIIAGIVITNWDQGILIIDATNVKIYDNIMSLINCDGITLEGSNAADNLIYSNIFQENTVAINLTTSTTSNTIYKNIITSNNIGLSLKSSGNNITANIIAENQVGIDLSNSNNNIIYHNNFVSNDIQVSISTSTGNTWDNGCPSGGNYWSIYTSVDLYHGPSQNETGSDGINDTQYTIAINNIDRYPLVHPFSAHDIGIPNVITAKTVIGQGYTSSIDLKILNYGMYDETFTLILYANKSIIAMQTITLTRRNSTIVTFVWDTSGFAKGKYSISAYVWPVPGETDTADNNFTGGWVRVSMVGDLTGGTPSPWGFVPDGKVDGKDIAIVALCFGSAPGCSPPYVWNPNSDVNNDVKIDGKDIAIVALHFGQADP
jgi:parallel beta-helix repeat protein